LIQLRRRHAKIQGHAIRGVEAGFRRQLVHVAEAALRHSQPAVEFIRHLAAAGDGVRVAVDADHRVAVDADHPAVSRRQKSPRVAADAEGAVDDHRAVTQVQRRGHFVQQYGDM